MVEPFVLDPATHVDLVSLTVGNLERSLSFYADVLGFEMAGRQDSTALLAVAGAPLLELVEQPGVRPKPPRSTGLYHYALLLPSRADLGRSLRRLVEMRWPLQGAADHLVSEALYLADPDGNGIEIYRDRPRAEWPVRRGQVQMATDPLDVEGILGELAGDGRPWDGLPAGATMGHVHLHVADLKQAEAFYCGVLGFEVTQRSYPGALFVSAGGYHHHLGLNTWAGAGAPPQPAGTAGLRYYTITLPNDEALSKVLDRVHAAGIAVEERGDGWYLRDPSSNCLRLVTER